MVMLLKTPTFGMSHLAFEARGVSGHCQKGEGLEKGSQHIEGGVINGTE